MSTAESDGSKSRGRSGSKGKGPADADKTHVWLSEELGTSLVAEATYHTDHAALTRRYNVHPRTIERWREKVAKDERLGAIVREKEKAYAEVWEAGSRDCARELMAAIQHHARLAQQSERFEPEVMHKCAGALKVLNDAAALRSATPNVRPVRSTQQDPPAAAPPAMGARAAGGAGAGTTVPAAPAPNGGSPVH